MNSDNKINRKTLSNEQLWNERNRYNLLVEQFALSLDFHENYYKKVRNFILGTLFTGFIFALLSSSKDSNIYKILNFEYIHIIAFFIFTTLILIEILVLFHCANKMVQKMSFNSLLLYFNQNIIFKKFVKKKIAERENMDLTMLQEWNVLKQENVPDLFFNMSEFEEYLIDYLKKYKVNFQINFYSNFANLILLNECINNILVETLENEEDREFALILNENFYLL